jgi:Pvc16 N-terminal domain
MNSKMGNPGEARLKIGNVALALDSSLTGVNSLSGKAILSMVNIEEDRVAKQQENYIRTDTSAIYKNPPLYLNMYILFAVNKPEYDDCMIWLGHIMQFFQHQQVFTPATHPDLEIDIQKLIVDMYSMNFEQVNHLWSTLGGKYMPSVLYKVRQLMLDENAKQSESVFVNEITIRDKMKLPVS